VEGGELGRAGEMKGSASFEPARGVRARARARRAGASAERRERGRASVAGKVGQSKGEPNGAAKACQMLTANARSAMENCPVISRQGPAVRGSAGWAGRRTHERHAARNGGKPSGLRVCIAPHATRSEGRSAQRAALPHPGGEATGNWLADRDARAASWARQCVSG